MLYNTTTRLRLLSVMLLFLGCLPTLHANNNEVKVAICLHIPIELDQLKSEHINMTRINETLETMFALMIKDGTYYEPNKKYFYGGNNVLPKNKKSHTLTLVLRDMAIPCDELNEHVGRYYPFVESIGKISATSTVGNNTTVLVLNAKFQLRDSEGTTPGGPSESTGRSLQDFFNIPDSNPHPSVTNKKSLTVPKGDLLNGSTEKETNPKKLSASPVKDSNVRNNKISSMEPQLLETVEESTQEALHIVLSYVVCTLCVLYVLALPLMSSGNIPDPATIYYRLVSSFLVQVSEKLLGK